MPRPNTGRVPITVKLSPAGIDAIAARAKDAGVDRSEMHRRMLAYAEKHMPREKR